MLHRSLCALSVIGLHLTGGAPAAQHDTCVANGCTEHKQAAWSCQCNAYCSAHGDCCADAASVCLINATKSEVGGKPARHNSSEEAHSHAHNGTSPAAGHAAQKPASHPYAHNNATAPAVGKAPSKDGPKEPSRGGGGRAGWSRRRRRGAALWGWHQGLGRLARWQGHSSSEQPQSWGARQGRRRERQGEWGEWQGRQRGGVRVRRSGGFWHRRQQSGRAPDVEG